MKKNEKRLRLLKETVKELTHPELAEAVGGLTTYASCGGSCITCIGCQETSDCY